MLKPLNKKAQIGETITWTAATFIIIGILVIFLVFSSLLAKIKVINVNEIKSDVDDESPVFSMKTSLAHCSIGNLNKETIDGILGGNNE